MGESCESLCVCLCVLRTHPIFLFSAPMDMIIRAHLNPPLQSHTQINGKLELHLRACTPVCGDVCV